MGLKGKVMAQKKAEVKESIENPEIVKENKETEVLASGNQEVKSYPQKIDKVYAQKKGGDAFLEVLEDGFNLTKENKGYATKVHFNFTQLDENMKQKTFLAHYLDITSFLYLRYLFVSGEAYLLEDEERASLSTSKKYAQPIYSEFKKPGEKASSVFSVTPGMKKGNWMIGVSVSKEGKTERVSVPVTTERLIGLLELIYLAYQKHLFKH